ncbi:MAG: beta-glucuronidase [Bacteroidales bacterium]|nr:beta-glucuronidase [Bacteroidales bacterium]
MLSLLSLLLAIDLSGSWQFAIDRSPQGTQPAQYDQTIQLPGSMLTNGLGDEVTVDTRWIGSLYDSSFFFNPKMERYRVAGEMKFPFFLTPEKQYVGHAWYKRTVRVPKDWKGGPVTLYLERPHIETTVYVNGQEVGHQMSLSVAHQYDIARYVKYGKDNIIEIHIYNGIENVCVGQDSHSVTDQTQGDWNGIAGAIELRQEPVFWRRRVEPDIANSSARIYLNDSIYDIQLESPVHLWSEYDPYLYTVNVQYQGMDVPVTFGMRSVGVSGPNILLNGQIFKARGTVGNCCFPETGYPPTDVDSWVRIFRKCQEYGLNFMRFHSYCPPEAAFIAADRLGFYLQPEGPSWPNHGVKLGQGMAIDKYLLDECKAIIDQYGSHPSLMMMAAGNEPAGRWTGWCAKYIKEMHQYDPTRIYCDASVGGGWAWVDNAEYHVKGGGRGLDPWNSAMPQTTDDFAQDLRLPRKFKPTEAKPFNTAPILSHETGQWCAFPDLTETDQYTGAYKARNFEIFADLLRDNGMAHMSRKFLMASGRLQTLMYKYDIERNLRTQDYAGFQLLALNDYSGQGSALVGVLNVHWREKGYCTAADWTEFCSDIVPLARLPKFVYSTHDTVHIGTMLYNASADRSTSIRMQYDITTACGKSVQSGDVAPGEDITFLPSAIDHPTKLTLSLWAKGHRNHWDMWVYPDIEAKAAAQVAEGIMICDTLDDRALSTLREGGKVLLCAGGKVRYGNDVVHRYLPVFWNTSWFKMRPPHTTGSYIQQEHPIFRHFPTSDWQDLNWWELVNMTQVINMAHLPADLQPIVQPIDTWHISRKLGMLFEANVLGGKLIMTTMDLSSDLDTRIAARQLRYSVLNYMQSADFAPTQTVDPAALQELFTTQAPAVNMFTRDTPDELKPKQGH